MLEFFKHLFGGSQPSSLLEESIARFAGMLDLAEDLLTKARPHLLDPETPRELIDEARKIDKRSNALEREVRKLLVEHLSFRHSDGPACLVVMSVAKDGERLVDECRNLFDLAELLDGPLPERYARPLGERVEAVTGLVAQTRRAFTENDERAALEIAEGEKPFLAELKTSQDRILEDAELGPRQAVIASRAFRIVHRLRAHLANIASTVILPVHRIDFAKREYLAEVHERLDKEEE